jgi:sulfate transport system substrate-binding protein
MLRSAIFLAAAAVLGALLAGCKETSSTKILNVSYDPTREFYAEFNAAFADHWQRETGQAVVVEQSHGGSGKQARAVIDGLEADVVTLALAQDIDAIAKKTDLVPEDWQQRLPHNSSPYTSTIVLVVRRGNPKQIKDWDDLARDDVAVVAANPKTGGGARWNYLAAWGYKLHQVLGELKDVAKRTDDPQVVAAQQQAREFVSKIYGNAPVLDPSARAATNTFLQREIGDVLIAWENEARLAEKDLGAGSVEIVVPSLSILAEPPVAVVEGNARRRGTSKVAEAYLQHLYSAEGQRLAAKHFYRPVDDAVLTPEQRQQFPKLEWFTIDEVFGGWAKAQQEHFDDGGVFDQIYQPAAKDSK